MTVVGDLEAVDQENELQLCDVRQSLTTLTGGHIVGDVGECGGYETTGFIWEISDRRGSYDSHYLRVVYL